MTFRKTLTRKLYAAAVLSRDSNQASISFGVLRVTPDRRASQR